jgi:hypothetical protein
MNLDYDRFLECRRIPVDMIMVVGFVVVKLTVVDLTAGNFDGLEYAMVRGSEPLTIQDLLNFYQPIVDDRDL